MMQRPPVKAPFRASQVRHIKEWQESERFHPLTCVFHSDVALEVEKRCLRCPRKDCTYTQDWAPAVCADVHREPESEW